MEDKELRGKREHTVMVDDSAFPEGQPVRIRCRICAYEKEGRCAKKNVKVAVNKPRRCGMFEVEIDKIPVKRKLKATYVPFHMRDKNAYKAAVKERNERQKTENNVQAQLDALKSPDCLQNFRSTAAENKD